MPFFRLVALAACLLIPFAPHVSHAESVSGPASTLPVASTTPIASSVPVASVRVAGAPVEPVTFWLPSAKPSGIEVNDRVWVSFYAAAGASASAPAPAVVLLHYLGTTRNAEMHRYARTLSRQNISAAVVTLPYHMQRAVGKTEPMQYFVSRDANVAVRAFEQGISDVSTVVTWLTAQSIVDKRRIGVVGVSLGAITAHVAMGRDARLSAGVALLGGGDLPDIYETSPAGRIFLHTQARRLTEAEKAQLRTVDPLTYAGQNQPRRVLMIQGARDSFIPQRDALELWRALGRPPIQWIDTNHAALLLAIDSAGRAATTYLRNVWSGNFNAPIPRVHVPTIQIGLMTGLDALITPVIQLQVLRIGTRHHMALAHVDAGLGTRGLFAGLAATVTPLVDVGVGRRLGGTRWRPYTSLHITF